MLPYSKHLTSFISLTPPNKPMGPVLSYLPFY